MGFGHGVTLEAVLVTALFLTHLAVEFEFLETLCFDSVGYGFRGEKTMLSHCYWLKEDGFLLEKARRASNAIFI